MFTACYGINIITIKIDNDNITKTMQIITQFLYKYVCYVSIPSIVDSEMLWLMIKSHR